MWTQRNSISKKEEEKQDPEFIQFERGSLQQRRDEGDANYFPISDLPKKGD